MNKYVDINLTLDRAAPGSLTNKLVMGLRKQINTGLLKANDILPPTRFWASELGVSRGTVVAAYETLIAEGYLIADQGSVTRVNPDIAQFYPGVRPQVAEKLKALGPAADAQASRLIDLDDLTKRPAWARAWRYAAQSREITLEIPAQGLPRLLNEISEHLRAMRATLVAPNSLAVTAGARDGLDLLLTSLGTTSGRRLNIGIEKGAPNTLYGVAAQHGANILELPVDSEGLLVRSLPNAYLDAVIVTPSFQAPNGHAMPLARRQELIAWGIKNGAMIIEDDFDTELRVTSSPLPTLASLDKPRGGVVATLASFSATSSLTLAAGFLILPDFYRKNILRVREKLGPAVAPILQVALAELLHSGELRRHVVRLRRAKRSI